MKEALKYFLWAILFALMYMAGKQVHVYEKHLAEVRCDSIKAAAMTAHDSLVAPAYCAELRVKANWHAKRFETGR